MIVLKISPLDVLMFRDGRPFDIGTDYATSLIFPSPHTTAGALRKLIGTVLNIPSDKWNSRLGDWKWTPLKITGPFLYSKEHGILVEAPKIFLKPKKSEDKDEKIEGFIKPTDSELLDINKTSKSGVMEKVPWTKSLKPLKPVSGFVKLVDLVGFFTNPDKKMEIFQKSDFLKPEARTHIRMEGKTAAEEDGKFSVRYIRLKDSSFVVALEKGTFEMWERVEEIFKSKEKHVVKLGGENRYAMVERIDDESVVETFRKIEELESSKSNLRIFITPFVVSEKINVRWAITSRPVFKRAWNKTHSSKTLSEFFRVYEPGCVFDFKYLNLLENESFKNFRSLGYNVSLGVRRWWER